MVDLERFLPQSKWFGGTHYVWLPSDKTIVAWCKYTKELFLPPLTPNSNDIYRNYQNTG